MEITECGTGRGGTMLFLHGGGLSRWNYREAAALLESEYRILLPVLDGHAGSGRPFTTIEDNAEALLAYIDEHCGGPVLLIGGLSLGGQILLEMLSRRRDVCRYALIESAAVIPSPVTNALIAPAFGCSYGLIRNRTFARMQFRYLGMKDALFEDYYRDTCRIGREDMIAFMKASTGYALKEGIRETEARVHVFFGERETGVIKRSAERIRQALPSCTVHPLPGLRHGAFSMNHAGDYAEAVRRIVGER